LAIRTAISGTARRTNPERAAQTRQLVLDAVIDILNERGFPALTNALIIEKTGISSGALMHHFPTREKLLIGMVEYAYVKLSAFRAEQLACLAPGLPRFRALIDMAWHTACMPSGFAVNEVRIGARSDQGLAAHFSPVFTRVAIEYARSLAKIVRDARLAPNEEMQGLWTATSMAMRSLAIDTGTYASADLARKVLLSLRTLREVLIANQLGDGAWQDPRIAWQPLAGRPSVLF
jgi:AcrR family transcriptional regulator